MKRWFIVVASLVGVIGGGAWMMTYAFTKDMESDGTKEAEVQQKAKTYLEKHLPEAKVTGSIYDNMGNYSFEYAARAVDEKTNTEFFVYQQKESGKFVDTYHAALWEDRLEQRIPSPTLEQLNNQLSVTVLYDNDKIQQLGDARFDSKAYLRKEVAPTLLVDVPRKRHEQDKAQVTAWAKSLREQKILQHMTVKVDYVSEKGELLENGDSLFVKL
ncbi:MULTISPECIES: hypothetical protein [Exiguobacterium]|uniref:hypothetical protein n=1 Tax=Exiguobacterium TaxID=33986 RepID=UPI001BE598E5|nr:hypothetical protein [Exiguobacterium sp. s144]